MTSATTLWETYANHPHLETLEQNRMGRESNGCRCDGDYMLRDVFGCDALYFGLEDNHMRNLTNGIIFQDSYGSIENPIDVFYDFIIKIIIIACLLLLIFIYKRWFGR